MNGLLVNETPAGNRNCCPDAGWVGLSYRRDEELGRVDVYSAVTVVIEYRMLF